MKRETYYCDICGKETDGKRWYLILKCNWAYELRYRHDGIDLCEDCADKISKKIYEMKELAKK